MSDTDSDADSISDGSSDTDSAADSMSESTNVYFAYIYAGGAEDYIPEDVRDICNLLRSNDPRVLDRDSVFVPSNYVPDCFIAVFRALKENTIAKHIDLSMLFERGFYSKRSALAAAEYVEFSKTLQTLDLNENCRDFSHEAIEMTSPFLRALSHNTSVTELIIHTAVVKFASGAFKEVLTCTQTLQKLKIIVSRYYEEFDEAQVAAIASGFANNTTLRDLEFQDWRGAELTPVLTALQDHTTLQKIHFCALHLDYLPSLSGLEVLLRSQDSKVKELVLDKLDTRTVGLHPVLRELERNTAVTTLAIRVSVLSHENVQQLKSVLRQNTVLQSLVLTSNTLGSAGLAEIAPVLYRNTSIKILDLSSNGLDDIESANVLHELLRRNKIIVSLILAGNAFGRNAAAARSILEAVRSNPALQQFNLGGCELGDRGVSILANALVARNASMVELDLGFNEITVVGLHALLDNGVEAVKTLTKLSFTYNPLKSEGATILADALGRNAMPNLKQLDLGSCGIYDDGFVALVSALEQNTSLQILNLHGNHFYERGFLAFAESLSNIKGLQQIGLTENASFRSTLPLLLEGFRKNTSLVEVNMSMDGCKPGAWLQELKFLGQRNRFTPMLKASDPLDASPRLGIWSRALAKVATEPDVLFHVLRNKPKLVGSAACESKKRKRNDE
jgi:Ran GTPase-activating protein (RanGAP) involved in mRNA processing and transport